eukprot:5088020-Amphidinium_carterae.1
MASELNCNFGGWNRNTPKQLHWDKLSNTRAKKLESENKTIQIHITVQVQPEQHENAKGQQRNAKESMQ